MNNVGIIIGRFQISTPHKGHLELIKEVFSRHSTVIIFVGVSPITSANNPLDYSYRSKKLMDACSGYGLNVKPVIVPLLDQPSDINWSRDLDHIAQTLFPHAEFTIYGDRDSAKPHYHGNFEYKILDLKVKDSSTRYRDAIANWTSIGTDERLADGIIWSLNHRFPTSYQCVDIIAENEFGAICVCRKSNDPEGKWRFPGGFVDVKDNSLEESAKRELFEETVLEIYDLKYLGSFRIDDWRYRKSVDKIMTAVFVGKVPFGRPEAKDDITEACWVKPGERFQETDILPEHQEIYNAYLKNKK